MSIPKPPGVGLCYIAGPMTGREDWNRKAFAAAAAAWREAGWGVTTPIELDDAAYGGPSGAAVAASYGELLLRDLARILHADVVAILPDWHESRGARLEVHFANACQKPVYTADTGFTVWAEFPVCADPALTGQDLGREAPPPEPLLRPESVLEEAQRLIQGSRQEDYGPPDVDLGRTGRLWGAILGIPDVPPEKVALCMVGLKISREVNRHKRDNLVDGCGYLGTIELIQKRCSVSTPLPE